MAHILGRVGIRRLRNGSRCARWTLAYESGVEAMSLLLRGDESMEEKRKRIDLLSAWERPRRRAVYKEVDLGGLKGLWTEPKGGYNKTTILHLHGGGYCIGSSISHMPLTFGIASACRSRVLTLDYRLAPEYPCPAALEDATRGYRWLLDQGYSPDQLVLSGDSAGGGLTVASLVALRDQGMPLPACAVVFSPWMDLRSETKTHRRQPLCDVLNAQVLERYAKAYAGDLPRDDRRVSPIIDDLSRLPPLMILVGAEEYLLFDGQELARRATEAGVDVTLDIEPDEVHVYPIMHDINPRGAAALQRLAGFITKFTS